MTSELRDRIADAILAATYPAEEWPDGPPGEGEMDTAREQADAVMAALKAAPVTGELYELAEVERKRDIADSVTAETKRLMQRRTETLRRRAENAEAEVKRLQGALKDAADQVAEADDTVAAEAARAAAAEAEVKRLTALLNDTARLAEHLRVLRELEAMADRDAERDRLADGGEC